MGIVQGFLISLVFVAVGFQTPAGKECSPPRATLKNTPLSSLEDRALFQAQLSYFDAISRKDFSDLKESLSSIRSSDTSPGGSLSYSSLFAARRVRAFPERVMEINPTTGMVRLWEHFEVLQFSGVFLFWREEATYTFRKQDEKWLLMSRNVVDHSTDASTEASIQRARVRMSSGDLKGARSILEPLVKAHPKDFWPLFLLSNLDMNQGRLGDAISHLQRLTAKNVRPPCLSLSSSVVEAQCFHLLGIAENALNHSKRAEAAWRRAVRLNDNHGEAWGQLGLLWSKGKPNSDGRGALKRAYQRHSNQPSVEVALFGQKAYNLYSKGQRLISQGQLDAAELAFEEAAKLSPKADKPHWGLAQVAQRRGKPAKVERELELAVRLNPKQPAYLFELGVFYANNGELPKARRSIHSCLALDPEYGPAVSLRIPDPTP